VTVANHGESPCDAGADGAKCDDVREVVCVVCSYYPIIAVLLTSDISSADCFKLPRDYRDTFDKLRSPSGRKVLETRLKKKVHEIPWRDFELQLEAIERHGVGVVTYQDDQFPRYLREIPKSPPEFL